MVWVEISVAHPRSRAVTDDVKQMEAMGEPVCLTPIISFPGCPHAEKKNSLKGRIKEGKKLQILFTKRQAASNDYLVRPSVHTTIYLSVRLRVGLISLLRAIFFLQILPVVFVNVSVLEWCFFCCYYISSFEFLSPPLGIKDLMRELGRSVGRQRSGRFRQGHKRGEGQSEGKREMLHTHTSLISSL